MEKIHILIMDGSPEDQKKVAEIVKPFVDQTKAVIHMLSQAHSAREIIREHADMIKAIIIDNNLKSSNVNKFISDLSNDLKGKVIIYSADDDFRLKCYSHMHLKIASKKRIPYYLEQAITQILE